MVSAGRTFLGTRPVWGRSSGRAARFQGFAEVRGSIALALTAIAMHVRLDEGVIKNRRVVRAPSSVPACKKIREKHWLVWEVAYYDASAVQRRQLPVYQLEL